MQAAVAKTNLFSSNQESGEFRLRLGVIEVIISVGIILVGMGVAWGSLAGQLNGIDRNLQNLQSRADTTQDDVSAVRNAMTALQGDVGSLRKDLEKLAPTLTGTRDFFREPVR